jgi:hypothetical protein
MARPQLAESQRMTLEELQGLPLTVDLVTAGRAHGLGRTISYELERAGEFPCPVHRRGRYYRVLKAELMTSLGLSMDGTPLAPPAGQSGKAAAA